MQWLTAQGLLSASPSECVPHRPCNYAFPHITTEKQYGTKAVTVEIRTSDPAASLDSDEAAAAYLNEALETGDAASIAEALGVVVRARGITKIAQHARLSRVSLYRALRATGNPGFGTVLRVIAALGLSLSVLPKS